MMSDTQDSPSEVEIKDKAESEDARPEGKVKIKAEPEEACSESEDACLDAEVEIKAESEGEYPEPESADECPEPESEEACPEAEIEVTTESIVEALLFSTDSPLPAAKIAQLVGAKDANDIKRKIETLNERYVDVGASFRVEAIAKGYQMHTLPVYHRWVAKLHKSRAESRLSAAALETLAIVAYRQPVLRAEIESVRGVAIGEMLGRLRDLNLIRIVGRAEEIGRPLLYGTTRKFLEVFGLGRIEDLPPIDEDNPQAVPKLQEPE